jgi:hypothetical protein
MGAGALALLADFIALQHRGQRANNLHRRAELCLVLRSRPELLTKLQAERLLRLGQLCTDKDATDALGSRVDPRLLLRVATEAINTLVFLLVEGVERFTTLSSAGEDKRLLDRYLRMEYATMLVAAGHPDNCSQIPSDVRYGDERDERVALAGALALAAAGSASGAGSVAVAIRGTCMAVLVAVLAIGAACAAFAWGWHAQLAARLVAATLPPAP